MELNIQKIGVKCLEVKKINGKNLKRSNNNRNKKELKIMNKYRMINNNQSLKENQSLNWLKKQKWKLIKN